MAWVSCGLASKMWRWVAGQDNAPNSEQVKCPVIRPQGRVFRDSPLPLLCFPVLFLVPSPDSVNRDLGFES